MKKNSKETKKSFSVAVVGATGLVGQTFLKILEERDVFKKAKQIYLFASARSSGKILKIAGKLFVVEELCQENIINKKIDYAFFSAGENIAKEFAPVFVKNGAVVIDNSSAFRMQEDVPLIVPEVNFRNTDSKIIANPNCSTIQAVLPLWALKKKFGLRRVMYATYQAVSGSGQKGIDDFEATLRGDEPKFYPYPIAGNVIAQIGGFGEDGYTSEEKKMVLETRKILEDDNLLVSATCVRVPTKNCHAVLVSAWLGKDFEVGDIWNAFREIDGITICDDVKNGLFPINDFASGQNDIFVGRVRKDLFDKKLVHFWCVADNVRKGAALNGVQILEKILMANKK